VIGLLIGALTCTASALVFLLVKVDYLQAQLRDTQRTLAILSRDVQRSEHQIAHVTDKVEEHDLTLRIHLSTVEHGPYR
jgi:hypothetical protein